VSSAHPRPSRVYETVLYASDVVAAATFYSELVGLTPAEPPDEMAAVFRLDDGGMLLVFDAALSSAPGRRVPSHGCTGAGHVAFSVPGGQLEPLAARLLEANVEAERWIDWPAGGRSLYVRDPAGNSVEFVDGEVWAS
jgi:catechol-2,3-dioxygenase